MTMSNRELISPTHHIRLHGTTVCFVQVVRGAHMHASEPFGREQNGAARCVGHGCEITDATIQRDHVSNAISVFQVVKAATQGASNIHLRGKRQQQCCQSQIAA
jgi:hypothetical protein